MELIFSIMLFIGGILGGLYGSVVGSAGLVSFPLLLLAGLPIHIAIATNRLGSTFLDLSSSLKFYKEKHLNLRMGLLLGIIAAIGSFVGSIIVVNFEEKYLSLVTAIMMTFIFLVLILKDKLGIKEKTITNTHWVIIAIFTLFLGVYGGFFGIGFGTLITFAFILIGMNFVRSVAISRVIGFIMSSAATTVFAYHGLINYPYAIALGLGLALGGWIGAGIGIRRGNRYIKMLFMIILLITIVKLIFEFI